MGRLVRLVDEHGPKPTQINHRVDGKTSLSFHVDGYGDRFVHVEDSSESDDFLVTCRNFRNAKAVVVVGELFAADVVWTELSRLGEERRGSVPAPPASPAGDPSESPTPASVLESFAHVAGVFLEDWHSARLTAQEVCETLWAAARSRKIVRVVGADKPAEAGKNS
jgi:hypothetical protein